MRGLCLLILLVFVAAVVVFALQNSETISVQFLNEVLTYPLSLVIGAVYLLGMFSGWTIVGMLKRTYRRVTEQE